MNALTPSAPLHVESSTTATLFVRVMDAYVVAGGFGQPIMQVDLHSLLLHHVTLISFH